MKFIFTFLSFVLLTSIYAQKKVLDHSDLEIWNAITNQQISPNGMYVSYGLEKGEKDETIKLVRKTGESLFEYARGEKGQFTYDSEHLIFTIKAWKDSINALKQRKTKKDKMPKDTLGIYSLSQGALTKIGNIKSYQIPEKWSGFVAYYLDEIKEKKEGKKEDDSTEVSTKKENKNIKKVSKKNGYHLVLHNLKTSQQDTFKYIMEYTFAKEGKYFAYATSGVHKDDKASVTVVNLETNQSRTIHEAKKAQYFQLKFSDSGKQLAFVADRDSTKVQQRPTELMYWSEGTFTAQKLMDSKSAPQGYHISQFGNVNFSKDESKLFFGLAEPKIIKDTLLTDDDIVNVEVWTYNEPRLYTVQELQIKNDTVKSFQSVINLTNKNKFVLLGDINFQEVQVTDEGNATYALISNEMPYELESQWTGVRAKDFTLVNTKTGERFSILSKFTAAKLSPKGKYVYGYNATDSLWYSYNIAKKKYTNLTRNLVFYDELNDAPNFPSSYGTAGFTEDDTWLILYDRYDVYQFNPDTGAYLKLTDGRDKGIEYRYVQTDKEELFLDLNKEWLLHTFNENTKEEGFVSLNAKNGSLISLANGPYHYTNPVKATLANNLLYTRESFQEFPDLRITDANFKNSITLSNANPQQSKYNWGTIELVHWISLDGIPLTGMLVKPENFDASKKYPMLVNFYERSSDRLFSHRAPEAGRSSINYSFYASRGYVIFVPDIQYRIGYPGESAFNCVIPGITSLIEKGFVDKNNIGVQGHSWGGYQIAYLVTKTDIFKAAESGAPVPNMISAYGGIRWWTGLSRQFQYEHTQSRIGGTPWEYPQRYIENSPIFNIDKIHTPLLILHNDADGHVPWYQGIEFFVSLRRLGKPSWFLNYNGEPHWPLKLQNRKDFNIRMAQFFDFYLKGEPKPTWMERGVPALEKGINQGLELIPE